MLALRLFTVANLHYQLSWCEEHMVLTRYQCNRSLMFAKRNVALGWCVCESLRVSGPKQCINSYMITQRRQKEAME